MSIQKTTPNSIACQSNVFENYKVRSIVHNGELFFSVVDVVEALTESPNPSRYWTNHKEDMKAIEGFESYPAGVKFKMPGQDGKMRLTECFNLDGIFEIMLDIRSKKARPFKQWISKVGSDYVQGKLKNQQQAIPEIWRPYADRAFATNHLIPEGFFTVFKELSDFCFMLIINGAVINEKFVPDISVGGFWSKHWEQNDLDSIYGKRRQCPHAYPEYFPQSKAGQKPAFCYPEEAVGAFRKWLRDFYIKCGKFHNYIMSKVKDGTFELDFKEKIMIACSR